MAIELFACPQTRLSLQCNWEMEQFFIAVVKSVPEISAVRTPDKQESNELSH